MQHVKKGSFIIFINPSFISLCPKIASLKILWADNFAAPCNIPFSATVKKTYVSLLLKSLKSFIFKINKKFAKNFALVPPVDLKKFCFVSFREISRNNKCFVSRFVSSEKNQFRPTLFERRFWFGVLRLFCKTVFQQIFEACQILMRKSRILELIFSHFFSATV